MTMLVDLALLFAQMSLLAFGGGNSILPEMQRQVVDVRHWMDAAAFTALFALAQAAPGPNLMIAPLIGYRMAGGLGALVSALAMFGPSSLVVGAALHFWARLRDRPWRRAAQAALAPLTIGLVSAGAALIALSIAQTWPLALITAVSAAAALATRAHPLAVLALGASAGLCGL